MNQIITICLSSGFSALLLLAVLFLIRNWFVERLTNSIRHEYDQKLKKIQHEYDQQLEIHKSKLKIESDKILETFKAQFDLQLANNSQILDHERKLFEQINSIITETDVRRCRSTLADINFITQADLSKLEALNKLYESTENRFITPLLHKKYCSFCHASLSIYFKVKSLYKFDKQKLEYSLRLPDEPHDIERRLGEQQQVHQYTLDLECYYRDFRETITSQLFI